MSEFDCGWTQDEPDEFCDEPKYTKEYVAAKLKELSAAAYGWHVNGKVLGMPVSVFERLMDTAAEMVRKS